MILGVIAGVWYWLYSSQFEETDDAYVTGHEHPVSFRVAGTSSEVLVDDNQLVKQGQPVAQLDPKGGNDRVASKDSSFRLHSFDYLDTTLIPYFLRKIGRFFSFHSIGSLTVNF